MEAKKKVSVVRALSESESDTEAITEFKADFQNLPTDIVISKWILENVPYIFHGNRQHYLEVKSLLSKQLSVDSCSIVFVGSSSVGFSLSPSKNFKKYDDDSDIDIAVISHYYFDVAWRTIRDIDFSHQTPSVQRVISDHRNRLIYWGTIATDKILGLLPFGKIGLFTPNDIRRMLDVEYVSELTIAMLNGIQNKKDKLETYYQLYEENDPDVSEIREKFDMILGELLKILPDIHKTRWSKKSDFYSLFLVFSNHLDELPLDKDARAHAMITLQEFGENVSKRMKISPEEKEFPVEVDNYAKGMRATSDFSSRMFRNDALESILKNVW